MIDRRSLLISAVAAGTALATPSLALTPVGPADMVLGSARAPVTVIEYASASCPHCARWALDVFPDFERQFIRTGQVRYVMREFLTSPPELAAAGFLTARCGGGGRYFEILQAVFSVQAEIFESGNIAGPLLRVAQQFGISREQFNACLNDQVALLALNQRVTRAVEVDGINSTPTFFVNGRRMVGEQTLEDLAAAVADARRNRSGES